MDRHQEQVELFRAFTVEELRERERVATTLGGKFSTPYRGEDSSSYSTPA